MYQMEIVLIHFLTSDKGQPLNKGQNGQNTMGPKRVRYSEVPLYTLIPIIIYTYTLYLLYLYNTYTYNIYTYTHTIPI